MIKPSAKKQQLELKEVYFLLSRNLFPPEYFTFKTTEARLNSQPDKILAVGSFDGSHTCVKAIISNLHRQKLSRT